VRALAISCLLLAGCPVALPDPTGEPPTLAPDDDDSAVGDDDTTPVGDDDDSTPVGDDDDSTPVDDGPLGYVGSPCESAAQCDYDDAVCLLESEGFPRGMCSVGCDQYCDDRDGHPVTFCVEDAGWLPDLPAAADLGDGACASRCDFSYFPATGCRPDYACVIEARANDSGTEKYVCVPGRPSDLSSCHFDLAARGIAFEPTIVAPDSPQDHPLLTCSIEDPVYILSPLLGVDLLYYDGQPTERVLGACEMAHALADTVEDVAPLGVVNLLHIGTYNCRVIAGTDTLSRHGYGDAIDIYGFEFGNGDVYTLVDDWEHDTSNPSSAGGQFLYDAAYRWNDDELWSIILTPNYNAAHDNHFHVDLTPGSDFIGVRGGSLLMMNPGNE
jgi:hypothetical protein